jgi:hypothetical protein
MATIGRRDDGGLYRRLHLSPDASPAEIARAYRRLAQHSHPDARPDDADAPRRFLAITEAYEILSDPQRRAHYDRDQSLKAPDPQRGSSARPQPRRSYVPPPTVDFAETTGTGPTLDAEISIRPSGWTPLTVGPALTVGPPLAGGPSARIDPPLTVGPLHWQPQTDGSPRSARAADFHRLLDALEQLGW